MQPALAMTLFPPAFPTGISFPSSGTLLSSTTAAAGDLAGTYAAPTVAHLGGGALTLSGAANQLIFDSNTIGGGGAQPLIDFRDQSQTAGGGFAFRFFALDTGINLRQGAVINGGLTDNTAGAWFGDVDIVAYGTGVVAQLIVGFDAKTKSVSPGLTDSLIGDSARRWANVYSVLGNFSGALSGLSLTTGAPTGGGTAAAWKLGSYKAGAVVLDATHYVEVDIAGVAYKLGVVA